MLLLGTANKNTFENALEVVATNQKVLGELGFVRAHRVTTITACIKTEITGEMEMAQVPRLEEGKQQLEIEGVLVAGKQLYVRLTHRVDF